jgi:arsenite/tail-anchored protein-transporting ATPase
LRLLELPVDWSKQIDIKAFASIDTDAADDAAKQRFGMVIDMMKDPAKSTFSFVMYPESTPILEAYRASQELAGIGIHAGMVVANYIIPEEQMDSAFVHSRRAMQNKYMKEISTKFNVPVIQIPLLPQEIKGLEMLTELGEKIYGKPQRRD